MPASIRRTCSGGATYMTRVRTSDKDWRRSDLSRAAPGDWSPILPLNPLAKLLLFLLADRATNARAQPRAHPIMRRASGAHQSATVGCSAPLDSRVRGTELEDCDVAEAEHPLGTGRPNAHVIGRRVAEGIPVRDERLPERGDGCAAVPAHDDACLHLDVECLQ